MTRAKRGEKQQQNLNNIGVGFSTFLLVSGDLFSHTCPTAVIYKSSESPAHTLWDQQTTLKPQLSLMQVQQRCLNPGLPNAYGVPHASSAPSPVPRELAWKF